MQLHPTLSHQLALTRQHDAESAAALGRRVGRALHDTRPPQADSPRSTAPVGHCPEPARA